MGIEVISCDDTSQWNSAIAKCEERDFYHTAQYHQLHKDGQGLLIVYSEQDRIVMLPLLIRPLSDLDGLSSPLSLYFDATSVYGYAGPLTNLEQNDKGFLARYSEALRTVCVELRIISIFSRLHPILQNYRWIGLGEVMHIGTTVAIDLTQPPDEQLRNYRKSHRHEIHKANDSEIKVYHDLDWHHYADFLRLYAETMKRVHAQDEYYFDKTYFSDLRRKVESSLHLFVALLGEVVVSAGLFTLYNNIIQYHFSGTSTLHMNYAASKLIIDQVRLWGNTQNARIFHLGGGVGSKQDSLFAFKAGFSKKRFPFHIWKWIVEPLIYEQVVQTRQTWLNLHNQTFATSNFFPLFRAAQKGIYD